MNELKLFDYKGSEVRMVSKDGEPWWVAKDVCEILEIKSYRSTVSCLDEDEKGVVSVDTLGGAQEVLAVNESGLYSVIFKSRKKEAKEFQRWVTNEVLPQIRKTGSYSVAHHTPAIPQTFAEALRLAADQCEEKERLAAKIELDAPKVVFAESVEVSKDAVLVRDLAKELNSKLGVDIGGNRMFAWLRENGYMISRGADRNMPTQKSVDLGIMTVKTGSRLSPIGSKLTRTPMITAKGVVYFFGKFGE